MPIGYKKQRLHSQSLFLCWHRAIFPVRRRNQLHSLRFRRKPMVFRRKLRIISLFLLSNMNCRFMLVFEGPRELRFSSFSNRSSRFDWSLSENTCLATGIKNSGCIRSRCFCVGIVLSSRSVARQVFSPPTSLTSVFGMGTGGPSSSLTPTSSNSASLTLFPPVAFGCRRKLRITSRFLLSNMKHRFMSVYGRMRYRIPILCTLKTEQRVDKRGTHD